MQWSHKDFMWKLLGQINFTCMHGQVCHIFSVKYILFKIKPIWLCLESFFLCYKDYGKLAVQIWWTNFVWPINLSYKCLKENGSVLNLNNAMLIHLPFLCSIVPAEVAALTILHSEWPKLYTILAILSAIGLRWNRTKPKFSVFV